MLGVVLMRNDHLRDEPWLLYTKTNTKVKTFPVLFIAQFIALDFVCSHLILYSYFQNKSDVLDCNNIILILQLPNFRHRYWERYFIRQRDRAGG